MCGIFGILVKENSDFSPALLQRMLNSLFKLSESRGKEAAGLAIRTKEVIQVYKAPIAASQLIHTVGYKQVINRVFNCDRSLAIIGHSRLVTDGMQTLNDNNQPVIKDGAVGIHNGIIVNVGDIFKRFPSMEREYDVDTEVLLGLIQKFRNEKQSLIKSVQDTFGCIEGAASIALIFNDTNNLLLATNTGSLYTCMNQDEGIFVFASERYILEMLVKKRDFKGLLAIDEIAHVKPWHGCLINLDDDLNTKKFAFDDKVDYEISPKGKSERLKIIDLSPKDLPVAIILGSNTNDAKLKRMLIDNSAAVSELRRCTRCVLPETFPGIEFDEHRVCNVCRNYKKINVKGEDALKKKIAPYRSKNGEPDCIVALSGGRDSSYALHYMKKVLKMNPIAYTYDWGMVTDLARRNQARLCGKLGVEHVLVSADITRKRKNIRKNVEAWLKKPDLGIVPLFMAGDKQYFYYMNKLAKQTGIKLIIFSGNRLEKTDFKSGFCGITKPRYGNKSYYKLSLLNDIKLASYYGKEFLLNPSYINSSILDTISAFFSYYLISHQYLNLYEYINWDEKEIISTLIKEYNWEIAEDTKSTWRIGDGTAPFYNYIYNIVAGFTENDTFRSNQIREGALTRNEALKIVMEDNKPRYDSTKWYCDTNGLDFVKTIKTINSIPKLYKN